MPNQRYVEEYKKQLAKQAQTTQTSSQPGKVYKFGVGWVDATPETKKSPTLNPIPSLDIGPRWYGDTGGGKVYTPPPKDTFAAQIKPTTTPTTVTPTTTTKTAQQLAAATNKVTSTPGTWGTSPVSSPDIRQVSSPGGSYSGGSYSGGGSYSSPGGGAGQQPAPVPTTPPTAPNMPTSPLNLPETPYYYGNINTNIADPYANIQPGVDGTYLGQGYWDDTAAMLDRPQQDFYGHLDPNVQDHYSGINTKVEDHYGGINPLTYQHYLDLDPTSPDYYTNLQGLLQQNQDFYEQMSQEDQQRLAGTHADIQVDPQADAIRRMMEQAELDAQKAENRVYSAYAGVPDQLDRREQAQATRDLESSIARGAGRSGAVEWKGAERDEHYTSELMDSEQRKQTEIMSIADQLGLTQRQAQERLVQLEELRGKLTTTELDKISQREWERAAHGYEWRFEAGLAIADRLTSKGQWEYDQSRYISDRMTQIDQFNEEQKMSLADRRTSLEQWMIEMDIGLADRKTALEQWEKSYEMEIAHRKALENESFRNWETSTRLAIGDRNYDRNLQEFNIRLGMADRTYAQAVDKFARELQIADRLTEYDRNEMMRALEVFDRTQLSPAQQYQLWITMAEVAGVFPDRLPGQ